MTTGVTTSATDSITPFKQLAGDPLNTGSTRSREGHGGKKIVTLTTIIIMKMMTMTMLEMVMTMITMIIAIMETVMMMMMPMIMVTMIKYINDINTKHLFLPKGQCILSFP